MYSKAVAPSFFFGQVTLFYKDGEIIASRQGESAPIRLYQRGSLRQVSLTRAQGFRYWGKHFPDRACYTLPALLEEAVAKESASFGTFVNRRGEEVAYEG
jgi:hypothetical protein